MIPIANILRALPVSGTVKSLVALFGFTDVIGFVTKEATTLYENAGRDWVVVKCTIKPESLTAWASDAWVQSGRSPSDPALAGYTTGIIDAQEKLAASLADFAGSFLDFPDTSPAPAAPAVVTTQPVVIQNAPPEVQTPSSSVQAAA